MSDALKTIIPGTNLAYERLGRVLVLGLGVSGKAVIEYIMESAYSRIDSLVVYAGKANEEARAYADAIQDGKVEFIFDTEDVKGSYDVCVVSPGIPFVSDFYESAKASSTELISEVEFAYRESCSSWKWVGVTGSNGKTTTTSLVDHLLIAGGFTSVAVGNIGKACITAVKELRNSNSQDDSVVIVCELSSYQLASISDLSVDAAVILGITPDHLSWHGSFEEYANAKFALLKNLKDRDGVAILDAVNDVVRAKIREIKGSDDAQRGYRYIPIGTSAGINGDMRQACGAASAAFIDNGQMVIAFDGIEHHLARTDSLKLKGVHNQMNALAASACACVLGMSDQTIIKALCDFAPLEHRIEPVATIDGVEFFNDSKATNVDSTLQGIAAMKPKHCIVMLGGRDKNTDLAELVDACEKNAKCAICFGEPGQRFFDALSPLNDKGLNVEIVGTFDEAFDLACALAIPGDSVLLSPACASFDEFSCFEERGQHFKDLVFAKQSCTGSC